MNATIDDSYEVVVLGGGIAGLLIASELAQRHKVVVLEKQAKIWSPKYWLTDEGSLACNSSLSKSVDSIYQHIDFIAYDGSSYRCPGRYILWDSQSLLDELAGRITRAGGTILTGHTFFSYRCNAGKIEVMANSSTFRAQLVVDCMGYQSPLIYAKGVIDIAGYYLMYGATFAAREVVDPVGLHNLVVNSDPGYVEAFPAQNDRLHLVIIKAARSLKPAASLREDFSFLVNRSPYSRFIRRPAEPSFLGGIIPVGRLRRAALDRMFFFGEAGQVNPPATATALTRMLYTYRSISSHLSRCIEAGSLSGRDLSHVPVQPISAFDRRLHEKLFGEILRWNSDRFAQIVREMDRTDDPDLVNSIMFGQLSPSKAVSVVKRLLGRRSFNILRYTMGGFLGGRST